MKIETWAIERILPYEKNARKIPQRAIDSVAASLKEFGWRQPIVVDSKGVIIVGHVRRLAAIHNGWKEAPVHVATDLTAAQIRAYRLMDNRSHDEATWDMDILRLERIELKTLDLDLGLTGFSSRELDALLRPAMSGEDDLAPVPEKAFSQPGDLWTLGKHRIYCGDCTKPESVAAVLQGAKPILMVTDPPYGISLDTEWRDRADLNAGRMKPGDPKFKGTGPAEPSYMRNRSDGHTEVSISGDTIADWSHAFELVPSLQVAYVWHASVYTREVLNGLERIGFLYPQQIIWNKGMAALTRTHYWYQHEPCWYVRKKNAPWIGKPGKSNTTIWDAISPKMIMGGSDEEKVDHPTQKPVELMRHSIFNHTKPGDYVYEPFSGSGTTLAAAEVTGRVCLAIEIEPKYVDAAVARWMKLSGKQAVNQDGVCFPDGKDSK